MARRVAEARLASVVDELAQQYGNLEKLLFTKVDAIITADLDSGRPPRSPLSEAPPPSMFLTERRAGLSRLLSMAMGAVTGWRCARFNFSLVVMTSGAPYIMAFDTFSACSIVRATAEGVREREMRSTGEQ